MDEQNIQLVVGESLVVQLPSRGSAGLRLVFSVDDREVADVIRQENDPDATTNNMIKPGDAFPAFFRITGKSPGETTVSFFERRPGKDSTTDMRLRSYKISVAN